MKNHPLEEILIHQRETFSNNIDKLVWDLAELYSEAELRLLVNWNSPPTLIELERKLLEIKKYKVNIAKKRGWDVSRIS